MSDVTEKPKKTMDLVAELHSRIDTLEERILVLEDAAKSSKKTPRKEGN